MRVKRFVADTMQEAIARVREEYGPDAVILQTRTYRRGLFGLMGRRRTEVLAAVDPAPKREAAPARPETPAAPAATAAHRASQEVGPVTPPPGTFPPGGGADRARPGLAVAGTAVDEREALLGRAPSPAPRVAVPPQGGTSGASSPPPPSDGGGRGAAAAVRPSPWAARPAGSAWETDGRGPQDVVTLPNGRGSSPAGAAIPAAPAAGGVNGVASQTAWPPGLEAIYRRLVDRAVEPPFAHRVVEGLLPLLPPGVPVSEERMLELARDHLASLIPVTPSLRLGSGPRRVVVLVGPTGVGKTTSLAKLAAHYGLMAGHPVGLLTFDTYRVGAAEQLRTYAEIIGLPMEVVYHPGELPASLDRMADRRLILVDTAGRSPQDLMRLQEMRSYLRMLPDPEVYLVLSATVRYADMVRAAERFEPLGYRHLIVTKVDETTSPGMVLNAVFHTGRPLAYLATGQDVPDDFEAADPDRIAARLLEDADE